VVAQAVTLSFGAEPVAEDGNSDTNLTVDFGFACLTTVTNTNDSGPGSLREAIGCANGTPGLDTIDVDIPGAGVHTIQLNSPLPQISDAVVIDGTTQAGFAGTPLVELDGTAAGRRVSGLTFIRRGGGSTIRGLAINRFDGHGILISRSDGNRIEGNGIGVPGPPGTCSPAGGVCPAVGVIRAANRRDGVLIESSGNFVGGAADGAGNTIGGNLQNGIRLRGEGNTVQGNAIGINPTNSFPLSNGADGVRITSGTGNRVSGNSFFENGALGIDLANRGPNANDAPDDPDTGVNNLQNTPEIASALIAGANLAIEYSVPSSVDNADYPLTVEFFLADVDGQEGKIFLGSQFFTAPGDASVSLPAGPVVDGSYIVATATDAAGNTSEFSAGFPALASPLAAPNAATAVDDVFATDWSAYL
jgi:parallel beta-helix repeat protein